MDTHERPSAQTIRSVNKFQRSFYRSVSKLQSNAPKITPIKELRNPWTKDPELRITVTFSQTNSNASKTGLYISQASSQLITPTSGTGRHSSSVSWIRLDRRLSEIEGTLRVPPSIISALVNNNEAGVNRTSNTTANLDNIYGPKINTKSRRQSQYLSKKIFLEKRLSYTISRNTTNPVWTKYLFGDCQVTYKRSLNNSLIVEITWQLPKWNFLRSSWNQHLHVSLRPVRTIPVGASGWVYAPGPTEHLLEALKRGIPFFPDDQDQYGKFVLERLLYSGTFEALEILLQHWKRLLKRQNLPRRIGYVANIILNRRPLSRRDQDVLEKLLLYTDNTDITSKSLHSASIQGSSVQKALVRLGRAAPELINSLDETGNTPLHHAAIRGHSLIVRELIDAGADVNYQDLEDFTPLMAAILYNQIKCIRTLLFPDESGDRTEFHIEQRNIYGQTALHLAARGRNPEAIKVLLEQGASPSARDYRDATPLHYVAGSGEKDVGPDAAEASIKLILGTENIDVNVSSHLGYTPVLNAVIHNSIVALRCLTRSGASFTSTDKYSRNILHHAASSSNFEVLLFLYRQNILDIDSNLRDIDGYTPWDAFILAINRSWKAHIFGRKPNQEEMLGFFNLYKSIRDRNIQRHMKALIKASSALSRHDQAEACVHLATLRRMGSMSEEHSRFYHHIECELSHTIESPLEMIKCDIEDLHYELQSSPWDYHSMWDLWNEPDDESESSCSTYSDTIQSTAETDIRDPETYNKEVPLNPNGLLEVFIGEKSAADYHKETSRELPNPGPVDYVNETANIHQGSTEPRSYTVTQEQFARSSYREGIRLLRYYTRSWYSKVEKVFRASPAPGIRRIEWKCDCGTDLYADFSDNREDLNDLELSLQSHSQENQADYYVSHPNSDPISSGIWGAGNQADARGVELVGRNAPAQTQRPRTGSGECVPSQEESKRPRFLALCVNTGGIYKSLAEDNMAGISSDATAFLRMKDSYVKMRGYRSRFKFLVKPKTVEFVQFVLWNLRSGYVSICKRPNSLPPMEANNYECIPPPMPPEVFIHYLEHGEGDMNLARHDWLHRLPKKLDKRVIDSEIGCLGWGIHVIEGPNRTVIFWICMLTIAASVLLAGLWSGLKHDVQGGAGLGALIIALPPAILTAFLFKLEVL